jgi:hypothetical protein
MAKRKVTEAPKPETSPDESAAIREAARRSLERPHRTSIVWKDDKVDAPHSDATGHAVQLLNLAGSRSHDFMSVFLGGLEAATRPRGESRGESEVGLNAGIAFVEAVSPRDEVEAALALQMAGVHSLTAELLGRAKTTETTSATALYAGLSVKLMRTFAMQIEALAKLRGGGTQKVEVKHVHISGNAVIGDVHPGGGGNLGNGQQPHAPCLEASAGPALPRPFEAVGPTVQVPRDAGQEALSDARRR